MTVVLNLRLLIAIRLQGSVLLLTLLVSACGDDVLVESGAPLESGSLRLPFSAQNADDGRIEYEIHCLYCHGAKGDGKTGVDLDRAVIPSALTSSSYVSVLAVADGKFKRYTQDYMPAYASGVSPSDCDAVCADNIQHYFYRLWSQNIASSLGESSASVAATSIEASSRGSSLAASSVMASALGGSSVSVSSTLASLTVKEVELRILAGQQLYVANRCALCHGVEGDGPDSILDTARDYGEILGVVRDGAQGMPSCEPAGDCAAQIADYIWVSFLGFTLAGGVR